MAEVQDIALILDILDKLGYNTESSGTATVFQRLASLGAFGDGSAVASVFGKIANLLAQLGTTGDVASSSGTALARLADLENKVGAINPGAGGTDTLFHYLYNVIAGIGAQADAANAAGSANAKLAAVLQRVGGGIPNFFSGSVTVGTSPTTVLSITGSGVLDFFEYERDVVNNVTLTVDGVQRFSGAPPTTEGVWRVFSQGNIHFNSSLTITMTLSSSSFAVYIFSQYRTGVV